MRYVVALFGSLEEYEVTLLHYKEEMDKKRKGFALKFVEEEELEGQESEDEEFAIR